MSRKRIKKLSPIFIDTGPLLLLLVGTFDKKLIGKSKRIKDYKPIDFDLLAQFLARRRIIVTPGVLAEVTNLAKTIKHFNFEKFVKANIKGLKKVGECHISKDIILESDVFSRLGYTDTSILIAAKENKGEVLTTDFPLYSRCRSLNMEATHFSALRERALELGIME